MEAVYDYRWALVSKHLRYASPEIGYVATEFNTMEDTWSGRFGAITCPAELQFNELRWLRSERIARDFLLYWLTAPDNRAHLYSWSLGKAAEEVCAVLGDYAFAQAHVDQLIAHQKGWDKGRVAYPNDRGWDASRGLYWNTGRDSSGEFNMASCQLDEALRGIAGYKIRGGAGYRPDINANMYGNLAAIARFLARCGRGEEAAVYQARADALKDRVLAELWEPEREFFLHRWRYDEYAQDDLPGEKSIRAYSFVWETNRLRDGGTGFQQGQRGRLHGRELSTYWMWHYGMVPPAYDAAWKFLRDPRVFEAPYGPCSAEQGDPWFSVVYGECRMNGDAWPLLTSRALTALKEVLHERETAPVTRRDFAELMRTYTNTQWKDGAPYCAESHDPYQPRWTVDREEGKHYFHSSYADLVISGLMGLIPREEETLLLDPLFDRSWPYCALEGVRYHGHDVSLYWDAEGTRYGYGRGFHAVVDGRLLGSAEDAGALSLALPSRPADARAPYEPAGLVDLAVNNEDAAYPMMETSCMGNGRQKYMQNGRVWYHTEPVNAWVSDGRLEEEWVTVDLGTPCQVEELRFCFLEAPDMDIALPAAVSFVYWDGYDWRAVGEPLTCLQAATIHRMRIPALTAAKLRMNLTPQKGFRIGVIEWEIWGKRMETGE